MCSCHCAASSSCICSSQPCSSALFLAASSTVPHHLWRAPSAWYVRTSPLCLGSCSACSLLPGQWLYLRAHSPYPHCTVLQLPTDVSAGFGQPELWLLLVPCQASSTPCRSVRGHPAPREPGMLTSLHTLNYRQGFNSMVFRPWLQSNIFSCYYPLFTAF